MLVDVASRIFSFAFAPDVMGSFGVPREGGDENSYLRELRGEAETIHVARESLRGGMVEVCWRKFLLFFEDPR